MGGIRSFSPALRRIFLNLDDRLRLILIALVVGGFGGLAACALNEALHLVGEWVKDYRSVWYAPFLPGVGAALSFVFLRNLVKEGKGHGVPEVIYSISRRGGLLRFRSSYSRLVSCLLTIASGGSAGPEAPVVISGGALGSNIACFFNLKERQRSVLVGCGASAAIAAIFNAPMAGIAFALETILGEWSQVNLIPIATASVAGTEVSRLLHGDQIPFHARPLHFEAKDLLVCALLAVFTAALAVLLVRTLRLVERRSSRFRLPGWALALGGGVLVGVIGIWMPFALGEGYEPTRLAIGNLFPTGLAFVLFALAAKVATTSLTLGTGGSGGLFAPCLGIGALTGLSFHRFLVQVLPSGRWPEGGLFALLGMAGVMSSVLQAPMTGIFLIVEITGGYDVLLPVVLVSVLSATLSQFLEPHSVYHQELLEKGELLRPRTDARILADLEIWELLEKDFHRVPPEMTLKEFREVLQRSRRNLFPVVENHTGNYLGTLVLDEIRPYIFSSGFYDQLLVEEVMDRDYPTASPEEELGEIMDRMNEKEADCLPVVMDGKVLGLLSKATILDHYRWELMVQE